MWITARVEATLSLYFRPDLSEEADLLAAATWVDCLIGIPREALEQAFGEWERNEERRPTPAAIRKRALARITPKKLPEDDGSPFKPVVVPPEELERRRKMQPVYAGILPSLRRVTEEN